jgi:nucleoside-triphosphatase THEP1
MSNREAITHQIKEVIKQYKNIVISGEVGVGKIIRTLEALQDEDNVYYMGNPVDYVGKPRPKGYDKYIDYIKSLKKDMRIIATEKEILSADLSASAKTGSVLVIDEIFGRGPKQHEKILEILDCDKVKVIIIAGCLKNIGRIIQKCDIVLMIIQDGTLLLDKEFVEKICSVLGSEPPGEQRDLFAVNELPEK